VVKAALGCLCEVARQAGARHQVAALTIAQIHATAASGAAGRRDSTHGMGEGGGGSRSGEGGRGGGGGAATLGVVDAYDKANGGWSGAYDMHAGMR
jgi:hypothetical protein